MAYTNPWSTTIPPGSAPANTLDTIIQQARLDIAERVNTLIGSSGSMSSDPVIDGTNALDLTALTTLANSKTTLSGLTIGSLVKATSASQVGNSTISENQLTGITTVPYINVLALPFIVSLGPTGTYLVSIGIDTPSNSTTVNLSITSGTGFLPFGSHSVGSGSKTILTFLATVSSASASLSVALGAGTAGSAPIIIKRLL